MPPFGTYHVRLDGVLHLKGRVKVQHRRVGVLGDGSKDLVAGAAPDFRSPSTAGQVSAEGEAPVEVRLMLVMSTLLLLLSGFGGLLALRLSAQAATRVEVPGGLLEALIEALHEDPLDDVAAKEEDGSQRPLERYLEQGEDAKGSTQFDLQVDRALEGGNEVVHLRGGDVVVVVIPCPHEDAVLRHGISLGEVRLQRLEGEE